ncbi:MAG TPA: hypothetical protein VL494_25330 [Steroidobacteraceae bacterium]|nr:hypothetical protein [Steroidobacteraceae bacterium]
MPEAPAVVRIGACLALLLVSCAAHAADGPTTRTIEAEGATVRVDFQATDFKHGTAPVITWIEHSMRTVARYYGQFPARQLRISVSTREGGRVLHGTTYGATVPFIRLQLGRDVSAEELHDDWILVHEMIHLALPEVGDDHVWLTEGLSTYVEGIARVQVGDLQAEQVFTEQVHSMSNGLPASGDEGLDHTHTWGRTYWGGALFCLLADVEIRKKTANRFGLRDAMRAVLRASGGVAFEMPIERVMKIGDEATGTTVLQDLYAQMKDKPVTPDLPALWKQLGIRERGKSVEFLDDAPLAATRKAIMAP